MVYPKLSSIPYVRFIVGTASDHPADDGTTKTQSPFAQCWHYLRWEDVYRLLGGRYPSLIALTDSCADPVTSP